jgi:hypothetical protein
MTDGRFQRGFQFPQAEFWTTSHHIRTTSVQGTAVGLMRDKGQIVSLRAGLISELTPLTT